VARLSRAIWSASVTTKVRGAAGGVGGGEVGCMNPFSTTRDAVAVLTLAALLLVNGSAHAQAEYEVVSRDVEDTRNVAKVVVKLVVLDERPSRESVDRILREVHGKVSAGAWVKYYSNPTAVFVYAYPTKAHTGTNWIGMLTRLRGESPQITVDEKRLAALTLPPHVRKSRNSCSTNFGKPWPSACRAATSRNTSRCSSITRNNTPCSAARG
jgi:hypothetical protein